jgi:hypothetical protein
MVEATALNSMESRSSSMSSPPYKISSKSTNRFRFIKEFIFTHLRSLNVRHFGMAEATRLRNVASRSSSVGSPAYQISWKSVQKLIVGDAHTHTQRHTGWWFDKPTFILESRLKITHLYLQLGDHELASGDWREGEVLFPL